MKPSKKEKRQKMYDRAYRISERQWWPGLHTRWIMEGRKLLKDQENQKEKPPEGSDVQ